MSVRANYEGRYAIDVTGHSIRSGFTSSNLPIGMQLGGRPFSEETLLRVAHAKEQATDWPSDTPPLQPVLPSACFGPR